MGNSRMESKILLGGFNLRLRHHKARKLNLLLAKLELLRVEYHSIVPDHFQVVEHPPPMFTYIRVPQGYIIHLLDLTFHPVNQVVIALVVTISCSHKPLRSDLIPVPPPLCGKCGKFPVILVQGTGVIPVPAIGF